jgi:hypothetical protein
MTVEALSFLALSVCLHSLFEHAPTEIRGSAGAMPMMILGVVVAAVLYNPLFLTDPLDRRWIVAHRVYAAGALVGTVIWVLSDHRDRIRWRQFGRRR